MPRTSIFISIALSLLCVSCHLRETDAHAAYTVALTTFEDVLTVTGVVEPLRTTTLSCPREADGLIVRLVDDGTYVQAGDTVCVIEDQNLLTRHDQLSVDIENAEANLKKVKADLALQYALLEAQVQNNRAETELAALDSLQMRYTTPNQRRIKQLELERRAIERTKYEKKLHALRLIQQSEVRKLELEIQRMHHRLDATREILQRLTITAPTPGLATLPPSWITGKKIAIGDNVWNNMPLVVIPEMTEMKVKIMASERDFKAIDVNDSVAYTFDAMPGHAAYGRVTKKMPVGQPLTRDSKVKVFEIEASVDSVTLMPEPGFTADCHVSLQSEPRVLVVPQIALHDEDSIKVVYVKHKKGYEKREVHIGASSPKAAVITQGLAPGEVVALGKPGNEKVEMRKEKVESRK